MLFGTQTYIQNFMWQKLKFHKLDLRLWSTLKKSKLVTNSYLSCLKDVGKRC
jgi:hypothetical protein